MFSIYLVTSEGRVVPLQFIPDPMVPNQIILTTENPSAQTAQFKLDSFQNNNRLFLGKIYSPQIQISSRDFYLSRVGPAKYELTTTPTPQTFSFALLNPTLAWKNPDPISNIQLNNLSLTGGSLHSLTGGSLTGGTLTGVVGFYFDSPTTPMNQPLVMSPDSTHGESSLIPPNSGAIPFGLRVGSGIYTYKIINGRLMAAVTDPNLISAEVETSNIVRERWFYLDLMGDDQLQPGKKYPVFILTNGQRTYLNSPQSNINIVTYTLSPNVSSSTWKFQPNSTNLPTRSEINISQFTNFALPTNINTSTLTMLTTNGVKAVNAVNGVNRPIWYEWWFWLIIAVVIFLVILFLMIITRKSSSTSNKTTRRKTRVTQS